MAAAPAAGSNNKAVITWVVRGVLIFILLGVGGVYLFMERPARSEWESKYRIVSDFEGEMKTMDELRKVTGKEPEQSTDDKTLTYTWKGVLKNYRIIVHYSGTVNDENRIFVDEVDNTSE